MSEYRYYIKKIYQSQPDQVLIELGDPNGLPVFNFRPGQYAMISYKNSSGQTEDKHAFSIASSPTQKNSLIFGIKIQGAFTKGLLNLKEGEEIIVFGPFGEFFYDENKYSDLVMIAGGIGITPFFSALNYISDLGLKNKVSLIYTARTMRGATFYEEIKELAKNNTNISALFSFTEETAIPEDKNIIKQRVDAQIIKNYIPSVLGKTFFICGPGLFMKAMVDALLSLGVDKKQIKMEEFSMIPDASLWSRVRNISYSSSLAILLFITSYYFLTQPLSFSDDNKYEPQLATKLNQATYERMIGIYQAKNLALVNLNNQIIAASQGNANQPVAQIVNQQASQTISPAKPPVNVNPIVVQPTPIVNQNPIPVPSPRTRVS